jgi:hypothetical protein
MSDAKAVQERAEGAHTERVILHVRSLCRAECVLHPKPVRPGQHDTTRRASARLGECSRRETQPNRRGSLRNTNYLNTGRKGETMDENIEQTAAEENAEFEADIALAMQCLCSADWRWLIEKDRSENRHRSALVVATAMASVMAQHLNDGSEHWPQFLREVINEEINRV